MEIFVFEHYLDASIETQKKHSFTARCSCFMSSAEYRTFPTKNTAARFRLAGIRETVVIYAGCFCGVLLGQGFFGRKPAGEIGSNLTGESGKKNRCHCFFVSPPARDNLVLRGEKLTQELQEN